MAWRSGNHPVVVTGLGPGDKLWAVCSESGEALWWNDAKRRWEVKEANMAKKAKKKSPPKKLNAKRATKRPAKSKAAAR